ncbi:SEC-C metal-binding domain-containing protein [Cohnella xylanilytica]|uniref:SEC-C metal-binding domain-containing protein n=1 Tax=Cohnella xylanilytica TaxID=557555 RepID=UPI001BB3FF52|nr:SEC-C metal-binding domain-containing protein [Cohnella xylanilytica]
MNRFTTDREDEAMLEELRAERAEFEKKRAKEEAKRWTPIEASLSLNDALQRLTKQELTDIRTNLNVPGASSLNKGQLADKLADEIPERLGGLLDLFDEERYRVVKSVSDRGGILPAPEDPYQVAYFMRTGMLFPGVLDGKRVLVMPGEVRDVFKALDNAALKQKVRSRSKLARLATGALFYYGVLSAPQLRELLEPHYSGELSDAWLHEFLWQRAEYAGGMQAGAYGFADEAVVDAEKIVAEHEFRSALPFRPFTTEELLEAGVPDYVDRNLSYRTFLNFIVSNYDSDKEDADDVLKELTFEIQNGAQPSELMEILQDRFEMADMTIAQSFVDHLTHFYNHTRMWAIKGYYPRELSQQREAETRKSEGEGGTVIDFAAKRKVGRNDPCPCGSGKKFKKCCGG